MKITLTPQLQLRAYLKCVFAFISYGHLRGYAAAEFVDIPVTVWLHLVSAAKSHIFSQSNLLCHCYQMSNAQHLSVLCVFRVNCFGGESQSNKYAGWRICLENCVASGQFNFSFKKLKNLFITIGFWVHAHQPTHCACAWTIFPKNGNNFFFFC